MSGHGNAHNDVVAPRSQFYQGPFGRMFRNLPPYDPPGKTAEEKLDFLNSLGNQMVSEDKNDSPAGDNKEIPAGYTYFGQFVDHDITFDPTSTLQRANDPEKLRNFRTPRLDLDNLYGGGLNNSPYLFDQEKFENDDPVNGRKLNGYMLFGKGDNSQEDDLPRNTQDRALIGDPRNDENVIVSQLQLAFIKFHNKMMDRVDGNFEEAKRMVRWHYQYAVVHDFLKRLCGDKLVDDLLPEKGAFNPKFRLCYYDFSDQPFMPVEFSVAAYRLGHSMIRNAYSLNFFVDDHRPDGPLVPIFSDKEKPKKQDHLSGFTSLFSNWSIQWDKFFKMEGSNPQKSRKLDTNLSFALSKLSAAVDPLRRNLATRNLERGWRMNLPSGQAVACAMGIDPLEPMKDGVLENQDEPLWHYILREAETLNGQQGERLGPVGARIVAEVFLGLLDGDPNSYFNINPKWEPEIDTHGNRFRVSDILRFAEVPFDEKTLKDTKAF